MKKMLLTVLLLLLLTGCSMPNLMGGKQAGEAPPEEPSLSVNDPEDETPEKPEADRSEVSEPETGKPEEPEAPAEPPSLAAPEADGVKPSGEEETSGSQQQETFATPDTQGRSLSPPWCATWTPPPTALP